MEEFSIPRNIYYGKDALSELRKIKGKSALVVMGGGSVKENGILDKVLDNLKFSGMAVNVINGIPSNPDKELIVRGAFHLSKYRPDWIVALGGGSPIDAAKAMWIFYEYPDCTFEEACVPFGLPKLRQKAHFIGIGTTSGTGTEVTAFSVITDYDTGIKWPIADFEVTPDIAIIDPELVASMPKTLVANTGMDALTHAIEAYTAATNQPFADAMALDAIRMVLTYLPDSYEGDMEAREMMHYAQAEAGIAFSNGLLGMVHSLAHKTGVIFSKMIPHGRANAIYLPYATRLNANDDPTRYVAIGKYLGFEGTDDEIVNQICDKIIEYNKMLGIPTSLQEFGIDEDEFKEKRSIIAENAMGDACTPANPREMTKELYEKILDNIYYGTLDEVTY